VWKQDYGDTDQEASNQLQTLIQRLIQLSENQKNKSGDNDSDVDLHSLWVHYNNAWKHSNSIYDRQGQWELKYGQERLLEVAATSLTTVESKKTMHVPLYFPPQVFRQANLDAFSNIVMSIREWLIQLRNKDNESDRSKKEGEKTTTKNKNEEKKKNRKKRLGHCLELYGGVGTIGLHLHDLFDSLESSDENPYNKDCFEASVASIMINGKPLKESKQNKITYRSQSATEMVQGSRGRAGLHGASVVIVDPPRKGLDKEVIDALCDDYTIEQQQHKTKFGSPSQALVYVSCGFDAFRRDYDSLVGSGKWHLNRAEGHILFPGSDAIETLAFFKRC